LSSLQIKDDDLLCLALFFGILFSLFQSHLLSFPRMIRWYQLHPWLPWLSFLVQRNT